MALVLFVVAATIITGALSAAVDETQRLKLNAHAGNLAATVLAEIQMGIQPAESSGPNPFEPPFDQWTWQTVVEPVADLADVANPLQRVEVIVRHATEPIVCRLTQLLPASAGSVPGSGPSDSQPQSAMSAPQSGPGL